MEVGQGPKLGCSAKGKKIMLCTAVYMCETLSLTPREELG
jgi:hypothetical protein